MATSVTDRVRAGQERGQSLVEFALTLPLLLLIVMGVVDLSFVLYAHIQIAAASGQGARAGSLFAGDLLQTRAVNESGREAAIRQAVATTMGSLRTTSPNFDVGSDVQVSYPERDLANATGGGEKLTVSVRYRQPVWFDLLPGVASGAFPLSSSTTMRIQ